MASTKIQNLPLKAPIGAMKIPTGGFGDYSITVSSIGDFIIDAFNLATKDYVDNILIEKEDIISTTGGFLTPVSQNSSVPDTTNDVIDSVAQALLDRIEYVKDNFGIFPEHNQLTGRSSTGAHPSASISHKSGTVYTYLQQNESDINNINNVSIPLINQSLLRKEKLIETDGVLTTTSSFSSVPSTNNSTINSSLQALVNRDEFLNVQFKKGITPTFDQTFSDQIGGYPLGAELVLSDGLTKVVNTAPNNTNNPNVNMAGWVNQKNDFEGRSPLLEDFGAKESSENSDAIQAAFDYLRSKGGGSISTNIKKMSIAKRCIYHDNTTVDFNKCEVTFTGTGQIVSALYNANRSDFTSIGVAEIYYKYQASRSINNPNSRITADANSKSQSIIVSDASGFAIGDYVLISNGYCDMWRVMERYESEGSPTNRSYQDWVRPDVDLWRCEIAKIKSISGTTIVFEDRLDNDYKAVPKTYGFFSDENSRSDHQTWNYPFIERLGGASNCTFKNIISHNQGSAEVVILSYCGVNNNVIDSHFTGNGQGVDFISCFNSHILRSFSATNSFGQSIRRGSSMCIMANASANYVSGDCPLIIWEGANHCIANSLNIEGTGGYLNHAKIGFYFNTCWNNVASNITGKNLATVAGVMFCRGGNIITNLIGTNCGVLVDYYASFDESCSVGSLKGSYKDLPTVYDSALYSISESNNIELSKLTHLDKFSTTYLTGRAHIYKSFGVTLTDIKAPNIALWNSVDDDKKYDPSEFKMKTRDCVFRMGELTQTYNDSENQTRRTYLKSTNFLQYLNIECMHNTELCEVKINGDNCDKSLILTVSHFTRLVDCEIYNQSVGIDFRGKGSSGNEYGTSQVYMHNTVVDAPTKFLNYADPSYQASVNLISSKSKGLKYLSVLTDYPKIKTYANPAGDGNTAGWFMVDNTKNQIIEGYTTPEIQSATSMINTFENKWLGREIYNTTISKFMRATGSAPTAQWVSSDGTTTITPA